MVVVPDAPDVVAAELVSLVSAVVLVAELRFPVVVVEPLEPLEEVDVLVVTSEEELAVIELVNVEVVVLEDELDDEPLPQMVVLQ